MGEAFSCLVPPPRCHMLRYHGVLAAHSCARAEVVLGRESPSPPAQLPLFVPAVRSRSSFPPTSRRSRRPSRRRAIRGRGCCAASSRSMSPPAPSTAAPDACASSSSPPSPATSRACSPPTGPCVRVTHRGGATTKVPRLGASFSSRSAEHPPPPCTAPSSPTARRPNAALRPSPRRHPRGSRARAARARLTEPPRLCPPLLQGTVFISSDDLSARSRSLLTAAESDSATHAGDP